MAFWIAGSAKSFELVFVQLFVSSAWRFTQVERIATSPVTTASASMAATRPRRWRAPRSRSWDTAGWDAGDSATAVRPSIELVPSRGKGVGRCPAVRPARPPDPGGLVALLAVGARAQEHERRLHAPAHVIRVREVQLHEDRVDVLLHRALRQIERRRNCRVALTLGNLGQYLVLAPSEIGKRRCRLAGPRLHQHLHDLRIDHGLAGNHRLDRRHQLAAVMDALLQQIRPAGGASLEERKWIVRVGVLAEHHNANLWMGLAESVCNQDALVVRGWRHADVGDHGVGPLLLHGGKQSRAVLAGPCHLDLRRARENQFYGLAYQVRVFCNNHADGSPLPRTRGVVVKCRGAHRSSLTLRQSVLGKSDLTGLRAKVNGWHPARLVRTPWPCSSAVRMVGGEGGTAATATDEVRGDRMAPVAQETHDTLAGLSAGDVQALGEALELREEAREETGLDGRTFGLVKIAALIALDAPPASYMWQVANALDEGATAEDVLGVLRAVAPQVGGPKVVAAAPEIMVALGLSLPEESDPS